LLSKAQYAAAKVLLIHYTPDASTLQLPTFHVARIQAKKKYILPK
jgi:hypothetical protein